MTGDEVEEVIRKRERERKNIDPPEMRSVVAMEVLADELTMARAEIMHIRELLETLLSRQTS